MSPNNRRQFLLGTGTIAAAAVGIGTTTNAFAADSDTPLILDPKPGAEYLIVKNTRDSPFGLAGHWVDFEYKNDGENQRYELPDRTIPAHGTVIIATGAGEVPDGAINMEQPSNEMNNTESDVYAILDSDTNVVARSDQEQYRASIDPNQTTTTTEETTTEDTTTEEETTTEETTTTEEETTTEETTTTTEETTTEETTTTTTTEESGSGSDEETTTESGEKTTTSSSDSKSEKEDC